MLRLAAFAAWFLGFGLEVTGAANSYRYRRTLPLVLARFSLCAIADLACFLLYNFEADAPKTLYRWASWFNFMGLWLLLAVLGCQVCAKLLNERKYGFLAGGLCSIAGLASMAIWSTADTLKDRLLDGASAADAVLLTLLALALVLKRRHLSSQWRWIAIGIAVQVGWDLLCSMAWGYWDGARHLLPIGEISALLMWNWAVRAKQASFAVPLGVRVEAGAEKSRAEGV